MSTAPPRSMKAIASQAGTFEAILPGTSQALAFNGTSAQSTAVGASTTLVRLFATEDCFILIGSSPVAAANSSMFIAAGIYDFVGIQPLQKIAAIQSSASGTLYITEAV